MIDHRYIEKYDMEVTIAKCAGNWLKFNSFGWSDKPDDADNWMIVYTHNRDSGLCEISNAAVIKEELAEYLSGEDIQVEHHGHWACGWIDGYAIRVMNDGKPTEVFLKWLELEARIADYPILDESDYSKREYEDTVSNIETEGKFLVKDGIEDWAGKVYSWLSESNPSALESHDDQAAYPDKEDIIEALKALDMLDSEYDQD